MSGRDYSQSSLEDVIDAINAQQESGQRGEEVLRQFAETQRLQMVVMCDHLHELRRLVYALGLVVIGLLGTLLYKLF